MTTAETDEIISYQIPKPIRIVPRRVLQRQTCIVRGFAFRAIAQMEGSWSGEIRKLRATGKPNEDKTQSYCCETRAISTKVEYNASEEAWHLREITAGVDGAASVVYFKLTPVADGVLAIAIGRKVESMDDKGNTFHREQLYESSMTYTETDSGAFIMQRCPRGTLLNFELINFSEEGNLCRTMQYFNGGVLQYFAFIQERHVKKP